MATHITELDNTSRTFLPTRSTTRIAVPVASTYRKANKWVYNCRNDIKLDLFSLAYRTPLQPQEGCFGCWIPPWGRCPSSRTRWRWCRRIVGRTWDWAWEAWAWGTRAWWRSRARWFFRALVDLQRSSALPTCQLHGIERDVAKSKSIFVYCALHSASPSILYSFPLSHCSAFLAWFSFPLVIKK